VHAFDELLGLEMAHMTHTIELVAYTDPYCTWCWGSEPVLRHLQESYGDRFSVRYVMGGLVEDSETFHDPANGIGGPNWLQAIADHWVEASAQHGMPVAVTEFVKTPLTSTWPSNIAYEAAKLQDVTLANHYLRRLREVAATEGAGLDQVELLADIAQQTGLDRVRFMADFKGQAEGEFVRDRHECQQRDVRGFPTLLVVVDGKERLARGYRTYAQLVGMIDLLAGESVERREAVFSDIGVLDFVEKHGSAAVREVAEVFEVSSAQARATLDRLVAGGLLELPKPGLLYRASESVTCDAATGECL
jgi:predicted DsbA family dithiol-disulfide isomerase